MTKKRGFRQRGDMELFSCVYVLLDFVFFCLNVVSSVNFHSISPSTWLRQLLQVDVPSVTIRHLKYKKWQSCVENERNGNFDLFELWERQWKMAILAEKKPHQKNWKISATTCLVILKALGNLVTHDVSEISHLLKKLSRKTNKNDD